MASITISALAQSGVLYLYTIRDEMQMDPPYQRASDIWSVSKKQLLIDSILNGFDIPKLYLHKLSEPIQQGDSQLNLAIVDGKQRLEAIWGFINGDFPLSPEFEFL